MSRRFGDFQKKSFEKIVTQNAMEGNWIEEQYIYYSLAAYRNLSGDPDLRALLLKAALENTHKLNRLVFFPNRSYTSVDDTSGLWLDFAERIIVPDDSNVINNFLSIYNQEEIGYLYHNNWFQGLRNFLSDCIEQTRNFKTKRYVFTVVSSPASEGMVTHYIPVIIDVKKNVIINFDAAKGLWGEGTSVMLALELFANTNNFEAYTVVPKHERWQTTCSDVWCQTWAVYVQYLSLELVLSGVYNTDELISVIIDISREPIASYNRKLELKGFIYRTLNNNKVVKHVKFQYQELVKANTQNDFENYKEMLEENVSYRELFPFAVTVARRNILLEMDPVEGIRNATHHQIFDSGLLSFGRVSKLFS